jgi:hypothetical protein
MKHLLLFSHDCSVLTKISNLKEYESIEFDNEYIIKYNPPIEEVSNSPLNLDDLDKNISWGDVE